MKNDDFYLRLASASTSKFDVLFVSNSRNFTQTESIIPAIFHYCIVCKRTLSDKDKRHIFGLIHLSISQAKIGKNYVNYDGCRIFCPSTWKCSMFTGFPSNSRTSQDGHSIGQAKVYVLKIITIQFLR